MVHIGLHLATLDDRPFLPAVKPCWQEDNLTRSSAQTHAVLSVWAALALSTGTPLTFQEYMEILKRKPCIASECMSARPANV